MRGTSIRRGAVALALLALAGCGSSTYGGGSAAGTSSSSSSAASAKADLTTANTGLGKVVVAAGGRSVYVFDKDTAGTSACTAACLAKWPPVVAMSAKPTVYGVTGQVGTIKRDDGTEQVTLAGMPLYLFSGDSQPGDVKGQAVGGLWWAVSPSGAKITAAAATSSSAPPPGTGY